MQNSSNKFLSRDKALERRTVEIVKILNSQKNKLTPPLMPTLLEHFGRDSFIILIGCLLSLRSRDSVTARVCLNLFAKAKTPQEFLLLSDQNLQELIHSVNYYKTKARNIKKVCSLLIENFGGRVPDNLEDLLSLPGVGPKTANLVMGEAFGIPSIYVDTHVHRLSNRLGLVATKTPEQTEIALKKIVPKKYWTQWSGLLVMLGQNISKCSPSLLEKLGLKKISKNKK